MGSPSSTSKLVAPSTLAAAAAATNLDDESSDVLLGTKRGRSSLRDVTNSDDEDREEVDARRRSMYDDRKGGYDSDDDEAEEDATFLKKVHAGQGDTSLATSGILPTAIDTDREFMDLVVSLAQLDLPTEDAAPEACPICSELFSLAKFAEHVYVCIRKLDAEERKHEEQLGEKAARALLLGEVEGGSRLPSSLTRTSGDGMMGDSMDSGDMPFHSAGHVQLEEALEVQRRLEMEFKAKRKGKPECPKGRECLEQEASHFTRFYHPADACPLCNAPVQRQHMTAHITRCESASDTDKEVMRVQLEQEEEERTQLQLLYRQQQQQQQAQSRQRSGAVDMMDEGQLSSSAADGSQGASVTMAGPGGQLGIRRLAGPNGTTRLKGSFRIRGQTSEGIDDDDDLDLTSERKVSGRPQVIVPKGLQDDDYDDDDDVPTTPKLDGDDSEEAKLTSLPRTLSDTTTGTANPRTSSTMGASGSVSSAPRHSADDIELNTRQLGAMARLVLEQKRREQQLEREGGSAQPGDASLHALLLAFEGLGFTKEKLKKSLERASLRKDGDQ